MALATRAENSESEAAIADKVRRNTQRVLEAAKAGNLLPRGGGSIGRPGDHRSEETPSAEASVCQAG